MAWREELHAPGQCVLGKVMEHRKNLTSRQKILEMSLKALVTIR